MEAEVKLLLPSAAALRALAVRLNVPQSRGVHQRNDFFDSPSGALHGADCHARLRHEEDRDTGESRWVMTLKGPKESSGCASLAVRPEEEAIVPDELADAILRGEASPLEALPQSPLVASVLAALAGERPVLQPELGFSNLRVHAPCELLPPSGAAPLSVTLELDTTTFSFGGVTEDQWEVECELQDLIHSQPGGGGEGAEPSNAALEERAHDVEAALQALLASVPEIGAPCPAAKGKRSRHKAFLKAKRKEAKEADKGTEMRGAGEV
jgi:hypothetical protein